MRVVTLSILDHGVEGHGQIWHKVKGGGTIR